MNWSQVLLPLVVALVVLAVALVGFSRDPLGRLITAVGDALVSRLRNRSAGCDYNAGFRAGQKFYRLFRRLTGCKYVGRILIFEGKNCGGLPTRGRPYRVSCKLGWYEREPGDTAERPDPELLYETQFEVDSHYVDLLIDLRARRVIELVTADLPHEDCLIGALYRREGVVYAQWFLLEIDTAADAMAYASVASYRRPFSADEKDDLRLAMERIRSVYRFGIDPGTAFDMPRLK